MSDEGKATGKSSKVSDEVVKATKALAEAIKNNGQCILNMNTISVRRSTGYEEHFAWKKSCDELAMAHVGLAIAVTLGAISDFADALKEEFDAAADTKPNA